MYGRGRAAGPLQPKPNVAVDPVYIASRRDWLRSQPTAALAAGAPWWFVTAEEPMRAPKAQA